jgi:hypothetical protein
MPITSIKPKIIGLVLLPGGRISFFLQGTYNALLGKALRPSSPCTAVLLSLSSYRLFNHTCSQNKPTKTMATINIVRSVLLISKYAITHEGEKFFTSKPEMKSPLGHGMLITASVWPSLRPSRFLLTSENAGRRSAHPNPAKKYKERK